MGIYDAMKLCKADVSTICFGLAASMGAFILAAGTKGKRFCMPNGRVMIHQPLGSFGGKATDVSIRIREISYHKVKLNKILSRITGKPEQQGILPKLPLMEKTRKPSKHNILLSVIERSILKRKRDQKGNFGPFFRFFLISKVNRTLPSCSKGSVRLINVFL